MQILVYRPKPLVIQPLTLNDTSLTSEIDSSVKDHIVKPEQESICDDTTHCSVSPFRGPGTVYTCIFVYSNMHTSVMVLLQVNCFHSQVCVFFFG